MKDYITDKHIIETDEENPVRIAVVADGRISVADGFRVRTAPVGESEAEFRQFEGRVLSIRMNPSVAE